MELSSFNKLDDFYQAVNSISKEAFNKWFYNLADKEQFPKLLSAHQMKDCLYGLLNTGCLRWYVLRDYFKVGLDFCIALSNIEYFETSTLTYSKLINQQISKQKINEILAVYGDEVKLYYKGYYKALNQFYRDLNKGDNKDE